MEGILSQVFVLVTMLPIEIFISLSAPSSAAVPAPNSIGFRADLTHVDAGKGYSPAEILRRAAERSEIRAENLAARDFGPVNVHPSQGEYLLDLAIGTPPQTFTGILDTGSSLIWTQCKPCKPCIPQPSPLFDYSDSTSFRRLPCTDNLCKSSCTHKRPNEPCKYVHHYADGTNISGFMGKETFTFGHTRIRQLIFGCGTYSAGDISNSSGIIGFGRGPISLISQLKVTTFSYCFTEGFPYNSTKSPLFIGSKATLTGPNVSTTPLILAGSRYRLGVKAITVGTTRLPIPEGAFRVEKNGSGGLIIDSGTALLYLVKEAYEPFIDSFKSQIKASPNETGSPWFELCYSRLQAAVPRLVFHLEDADWEMPLGNYMVQDADNHLSCLGVQKSQANILGNMQTQNMHVLYDLEKKTLSFMPAKCDQL